MIQALEIAPKQLEQSLVKVEQPLIVKGLVDAWPIVQAAKESNNALSDYLIEHGQNITVGTGLIADEHQGRLFYKDNFDGFNFTRTSRPFFSFLATLFEPSSNSLYMGSTNVEQLFRHFKQDNPLLQLAHLNPLVSAWLSNKTLVAPHQDFPDNLAVCVAGKRRFTLFPPDQVENLYVGPLDNTPAGQPISLVNIREPDFAQHPKYKIAQTNAVTAELKPGDALLIPSLWWHAVESLEQVNVLINYWWQNSANTLGSPMDALLHAIMNISTLTQSQKQAMKVLFEHYVFSDEATNDHIPNHAKGVLSGDDIAVRRIRAYLINKLNQ